MIINEGLNVSQGGVGAISTMAQPVQNGKSIVGDSQSQPALNDNLLARVLAHCGLSFTTLDETPSADPHARCCGEGGLNTRLYPIVEIEHHPTPTLY